MQSSDSGPFNFDKDSDPRIPFMEKRTRILIRPEIEKMSADYTKIHIFIFTQKEYDFLIYLRQKKKISFSNMIFSITFGWVFIRPDPDPGV